MPQENQILRCFSCETFQVHIVKKTNKWECKMCGAKQSFKRHYGKGTGKDCRNHVMKLNELRVTNSCPKNLTEDEKPEEVPPESKSALVEKKLVSKWACYLDEDINSDNENEDCKPKKKRKIYEDCHEVKNMSDELVTDTLDGAHESSTTLNSKHSSCFQVEVTTERKKSKNIFDSDLDNAEDFLNFI